ncbi:hypothetical protein DRF62_18780 [Chryseobacterium piscium]|uniref:AAA+ ATPase domain-containing protein n=1 Tax=Chryseobacterium piscium TaxID=333702 RepID=A0A3D9BAL8_9FLAO|nr:AAA family ATPase [Chryseobacterium piscium]REC50684.1 hypothetical protein DRF62_18780 [Chryseobacterium piscium]
MELDLKNKIREFLNSDSNSSIINSKEFYFQKAKDASSDFLKLQVSEENKAFLLSNRKEYSKLKQLFEDTGELAEFGNLIFTIISYCDSKAYKKNEFNQYKDKRVLALAFVRMNYWIEHLITYKFENKLDKGSIKNAIDYLLNPIENFTMLSENHRKQLSEKLFKKSYDKSTFKGDVINFFSEFSIEVLNPLNYTHLLTRIIYSISSEWKENLVGIMASDSTGWLSDFQMKDTYAVFWNSKKPSGTNDTIRLLKECIIEKGHFKLFYTSYYKVNYIAEVIDVVEGENEYLKADWEVNYRNDYAYPKFEDLQDDNKSAKIIFLINKFYQVDSIPIDQFKLFKNYSYPRQDNLTPIENYITNSQHIENILIKKMKQLLLYKKQIILQGPPGTGKTRLATEIAKSLIKNNSIFDISEDNILSFFKINQEITARKESTKYTIKEINKDSILLSTTREDRSPTRKQIYESYVGKLWQKSSEERKSNTLSYADALAKNIYERFNSIKNNSYYKIIQFHPSYTYEDFVRGIVAIPNENGEGILYKGEDKILAKLASDAKEDSDNNYILIIDEINRANLSSVLGELIYALEYRGEEVESMYSVDESILKNKLVLPPNLYIIGTMNTADRSVGHIDYAIRRRFAFVDVLPKELEDDNIVFHKEIFRKVSELFITNFDEYNANEKTVLKRANTLSGEFRPEDVWIGHSYFIQKKLEDGSFEPQDFTIRLDYEIKPILLEYVKDGVLNGKVGEMTVEEYIKSL